MIIIEPKYDEVAFTIAIDISKSNSLFSHIPDTGSAHKALMIPEGWIVDIEKESNIA
jgi:hypothetical protein